MNKGINNGGANLAPAEPTRKFIVITISNTNRGYIKTVTGAGIIEHTEVFEPKNTSEIGEQVKDNVNQFLKKVEGRKNE